MKKQGKHLILLVISLAVLAIGYICLIRYNDRQQEIETNRVEGQVLVDIAADDIQRFSYEYDGETYTFEKTEEGIWISADDPSLNLMQSRLNTMVNKFTHIVAQNTIADVTDMSQYGLEQPLNILHWETDQAEYTYCVGDYNSFGSLYYIREPDSHTVYGVTASLGTGFGYNLEELTEEDINLEESGAE